jgi:glucosamine-6-phosphate deaminase
VDLYRRPVEPGSSPLPLEIVESDIDLYYRMALAMYLEVERNNAAGADTVFILPVGPVYQYRRFVWLCGERPLDLSRLHCFFMDEYLDEKGGLLDPAHPLSFRGFVQRELVEPMPASAGLRPAQVLFPDPADPGDYDRRLAALGGAEVCFAGVGINGHLAFNEPPEEGAMISSDSFRALGTRVVALSRETITINSNTALAGAYDRVPQTAVSIGMRQILEARRVVVGLNRPWQRAVVRRLLYGPVSPSFPASLLRDHPNVRLILTREVAAPPKFQLG